MINPNLADPPDWAREIALAKWIGCKPWELDDVPEIWLTRVATYIGASQVRKVD